VIRLPPPAWLRAACLVAFMAMLVQIFVLSEPRFVLDVRQLAWDKMLHASAFGALALLLWTSVGYRAPWLNWLAIAIIGALDELHQIYVPGRSADVLDVAADAIGAAIVTYAMHRIARAAQRKSLPRAVDRLYGQRA
jgi:VanZ family protein